MLVQVASLSPLAAHPANQPSMPLSQSSSSAHHDLPTFRRSIDCRHNQTPTYNNCTAHTTDDTPPTNDWSEEPNDDEWVVAEAG